MAKTAIYIIRKHGERRGFVVLIRLELPEKNTDGAAESFGTWFMREAKTTIKQPTLSGKFQSSDVII